MTFLPPFLPPMKVGIESKPYGQLLRWKCPVKCKPVSISVGDKSAAGRAYAETVKAQIENDAKFGYYDATLLKYKPRTIGSSECFGDDS